MQTWDGKYQWYCGAQAHDGGPGPDGPPQTRSFFTDEDIKEAENGNTSTEDH